jgi:hypothetical protein
MNLIYILVRVPLIALLFTLPIGTTTLADDHAEVSGPLTLQIEYWAVYEAQERDDEGWLLAWKAKASGDLTGEMRWWFPKTPPAPDSIYSHGEIGYYLARWELWVDEELVLAGESAGKTLIPEGEDGIWDGYGIVTKTNAAMSSLKGGRTYETGTVINPKDRSAQSTGTGMFVIF